jgi:hypothetical protein
VITVARRRRTFVQRVFTWQNGFNVGATATLRELVLGSEPRLHHILTIGLTTGWGP